MIDVLPIIIPKIDTTMLIAYGVNFLGRPISKGADDQRIKVDSFDGFFTIMKEVTRNPNLIPLQKLLNFGFMIYANREVISQLTEIMGGSRASEQTILIVTHNLHEWAVICAGDYSTNDPETNAVIKKIRVTLQAYGVKECRHQQFKLL